MLRLVIEDGEGTTHVVPLIRDEITVGRQEGNTIRLTERNVSRRHARLTRTGTDDVSPVIIEDLHSYNGVRVNGERIAGQCSLRPDDTVQIGDYFLALEAEERAAAGIMETVVTSILSEDISAPLDDAAQARLIVVSSNLAGQEYPLTLRENQLGRTESDGNELVVNHRSISRNHAKIIWRDGQFTVIDMASANGVIVNGQALSSASLVNGDILEMGHVKFRFSAPGDDYRFSVADIDDVILPPNDGAMRALAVAVVLLFIALAAYVVTVSMAPQGGVDADSSQSAVGATEQSDTKPNIVEPIPETPQREAQVEAQLLVEARNQQDGTNWGAARSIYQRILAMSPDQPVAKAGLIKVGEEERNHATARKIKVAVEERRWSDALKLSNGFDSESFYAEQVASLRPKIEKSVLNDLEKTARAAMAKSLFSDARKAATAMGQYRFGTTAAAALSEEIDEAERRGGEVKVSSSTKRLRPKKARRLKPKKRPKPKKAPAKSTQGGCKSYATCIQQAKKLYYKVGKKTPEVLRRVESLYRQAIRINPRKKSAYQFLCPVLRKQRNYRGAIKICRTWAEKETNPSQRDTVMNLVRDLEESSGR